MAVKNTNGTLNDLKDGSEFCDLPVNVLPYVLYYDEIECGNPLGSHKGSSKIGPVYFALRCFPPYVYSELKHIFVCCLFPSTNKAYLNVVVEKLYLEINELSSVGLVLFGQTIYFRFAGVIGDNLGLHQVLGFVESFSANFPCRMCKSQRNETQHLTKENVQLLRNKENYAIDVTKPTNETGINRESVLNKLSDYHVTSNNFVDVMHDIAEGVASFGMLEIINHYLNCKIFTLEVLNDRIKCFPYFDISNKPPPVTYNNILKGRLSYSAAEMINLVLYFGLMVGDIVCDDDVWLYYKTLRMLVNICLRKSYQIHHVNHLRSLIDEHHVLYMSLFKKSLKPKHHHLIHYPTCLLKTGPLTHNWSMRFESKHTLIKLIATISRSKVNLCKTVILRYMYVLSHDLFFTSHDLSTISDVGPMIEESHVNCYRWVIRKGIKYSVGNVVCFGYDMTECHHLELLRLLL